MDRIKELISLPTEELLRKEYGKLSLESIEPQVVLIKKILKSLLGLNIEVLKSKERAVLSFVEDVQNLFMDIMNYQGINREQLILKVNKFDIPADIYALIAANIAINNKIEMDDVIKNQKELYQSNFEQILQESNKKINEIFEKIKKEEQGIKQLGTESEDILKKMKENMATTGIADYADIFQKESNIHKKNSQYWFYGIIGIVIVIIITALCLLLGCFSPQDDKMRTLVQFTFAKLIIFSSLFFLLTLAFKSYKASKHNEILNKHRQNAITTFEKFVKSANDDRTKNAVLLQTVDAIFSQQNTGYNDSDNDVVSPQTKILEIINSSAKND